MNIRRSCIGFFLSLDAEEEEEEGKVVTPAVCGPSSAVVRLASSLIA